MDRINKTELAKRLKKSQAYISKLIKTQKLKFDNDGLVDYSNALNQIKKNTERIKLSKVKSTEVLIDNDDSINSNVDSNDLLFYKTQTEKWKAQREEQIYKKEQKLLIPIEQIEEDAFRIGKSLTDQLLTIPDRICDVIAAESDATIIRKLLIEEIKKTLNEIIKEIEDY